MAPEWGDGIAGALRLLPTRASERSNGMERREFIALIAGGAGIVCAAEVRPR